MQKETSFTFAFGFRPSMPSKMPRLASILTTKMNKAIAATLLLFTCLHSFCIAADPGEKPTTVYLQPNTTQLFTELYQAYGILNPPARTVFEDALYLDQSTPMTILPLQPSNQAIFDHASDVLTTFHTRMNDLELYIDPKQSKPMFYTAAGSKHLIVALVYGIVMSEPNKKFLFVEQAPYYSGHPSAVSGIFHYPNARFQLFHDPSEIKPEPDEVLVEFVTSPNNPDGKFRKPVTNATIIIADFVFASAAFGGDGDGYLNKNIAWIRQARAQGKHIFSFNSASKQFGKTGTRCGYIWYPIDDPYAASIFKSFFGFISASTVAGGSTGLAEFLNLIQALLDLPDGGKALRRDANKSLVQRHKLVEQELLNRYPGSTILSIPGSPTFFAKLKDGRISNKRASDVILEDIAFSVNNGEPMGESNEFIRINLSGYSPLLAEFLNRLANQHKYSTSDLLLTTAQTCQVLQVCGNSESTSTLYFVKPGDCIVEVDASKGPVEVILPPFTDYLTSNAVTIKKIDTGSRAIVIKAENLTTTLKQANDSVQVRWTQPLYHKGHWEVQQ